MIKWAEFIKSSASKDGWIDDNVPEVLFVGRSNVGKSSIINALTNNKKMAKVSASPGKTRLLNFFDINHHQFRIVDAPGYGYAKVSGDLKASFAPMMEEYLTNRTNLGLVLMLVDLRHPPSKDDLMMYDYLKHYHVPVVLIGTKLDKLKQNEIKKNVELIRTTLKVDPTTLLIKTSVTKNQNIDQIYLTICQYLHLTPLS